MGCLLFIAGIVLIASGHPILGTICICVVIFSQHIMNNYCNHETKDNLEARLKASRVEYRNGVAFSKPQYRIDQQERAAWAEYNRHAKS